MNNRLFALQQLKHTIQHEAVRNRIEEMRHDESPTVRKQANHILNHRSK